MPPLGHCRPGRGRDKGIEDGIGDCKGVPFLCCIVEKMLITTMIAYLAEQVVPISHFRYIHSEPKKAYL